MRSAMLPTAAAVMLLAIVSVVLLASAMRWNSSGFVAGTGAGVWYARFHGSYA